MILLLYGIIWLIAPFYAMYSYSITGNADWLIFEGTVQGESIVRWLAGIVPALIWFFVLLLIATILAMLFGMAARLGEDDTDEFEDDAIELAKANRRRDIAEMEESRLGKGKSLADDEYMGTAPSPVKIPKTKTGKKYGK